MEELYFFLCSISSGSVELVNSVREGNSGKSSSEKYALSYLFNERT